jgi:hypothetical protein
MESSLQSAAILASIAVCGAIKSAVRLGRDLLNKNIAAPTRCQFAVSRSRRSARTILNGSKEFAIVAEDTFIASLFDDPLQGSCRQVCSRARMSGRKENRRGSSPKNPRPRCGPVGTTTREPGLTESARTPPSKSAAPKGDRLLITVHCPFPALRPGRWPRPVESEDDLECRFQPRRAGRSSRTTGIASASPLQLRPTRAAAGN